MKKPKAVSAKQKKNETAKSYAGFDNQTDIQGYLKYTLYFILLALPIYLAYNYYSNALFVNGANSFPLDDGWIHLTFAKNLNEYFSFSYYKDQMVTAGSTSPLYTFIVAAGFFFTRNEMLLSYFLGAAFFAAAALILFKLCMLDFRKDLLASLVCAGIFILDRNMNFISLSGMETTMYVFILLLGAYLYRKNRTYSLALILGLVIWSRPDGIAFIAAVIIDLAFGTLVLKNEKLRKAYDRRTLLIMTGIFAVIAGLYFLMNFVISGTPFPNTYSAKVAYFAEIEKKISYFSDKVFPFFSNMSYGIIAAGFIIAFLKFIYDTVKLKTSENSLYIIFTVLFLMLYMVKLPEVNRFGRYVMPLIPFFILVSVAGFRDFLILLNKFISNQFVVRLVFILLAGLIFYQSINSYETFRSYYAEQCRYIYDRQVKTAMWLKDNTGDNDILGVHDIGAIGFYTGRKIIDVAGLVSPYLNKRLLEKDYSRIMTQYLKEQGVTYVAFLREWYRVVNQKPLFKTPDNSSQEVMEVFRFIPDTTYIISKDANYIMNTALRNLSKKDGNDIVNKMDSLLVIEPIYAEAYYLRSYGYSLLNNSEKYEEDLRNSVKYYPGFLAAQKNLGLYLKENGRSAEAEQYLRKALELDPSDQEVINSLKNTEEKK
ncbi:MAG: hypothetical protein JSS91_02590 [Bacteroidetes bacterium]|nr:hypothetical protein [Bacteroidota bacterium]